MIRITQLILITLILQDFLLGYLPLMSYIDEVLCIISLFYSIFILLNNKIKIKFTKYEIIAMNMLIIYMIIGIISNLRMHILGLEYAFLSMIMTVKGYILYFSYRIIFQVQRIRVDILKNITSILKVIMYVLCIIGLINIPLGFLKSDGIRFGINTVSIGFSHPTELAFFTIISISIILFYDNYTQRNNKISLIIISSILVFLTGRSKAIGFMVIYILLYYSVRIFNKIKIMNFIYLTPILIYIGLPRLKSEILDGARGYLYTTGINIAKDNFPLGTGFGTFGSHISRVFYSPLYFEYGISSIWGLSPDKSNFISDTYWAMIIGENGFIGFILIVLILVLIFTQFIKVRINNMSKISILGLLIYTIISSIAEPIYSSNKSAALFILLALLITIINTENKSTSMNINK